MSIIDFFCSKRSLLELWRTPTVFQKLWQSPISLCYDLFCTLRKFIVHKQRPRTERGQTMAHYCTHLCYLLALHSRLLMPGIVFTLINYERNNSHLRPERLYDELGHWSGSFLLAQSRDRVGTKMEQ